jgi:hypothetical protein
MRWGLETRLRRFERNGKGNGLDCRAALGMSVTTSSRGRRNGHFEQLRSKAQKLKKEIFLKKKRKKKKKKIGKKGPRFSTNRESLDGKKQKAEIFFRTKQ